MAAPPRPRLIGSLHQGSRLIARCDGPGKTDDPHRLGYLCWLLHSQDLLIEEVTYDEAGPLPTRNVVSIPVAQARTVQGLLQAARRALEEQGLRFHTRQPRHQDFTIRDLITDGRKERLRAPSTSGIPVPV